MHLIRPYIYQKDNEMTATKEINIFLRKFSACVGAMWLGGRFIPLVVQDYIQISILSDGHVFICGASLMAFMKVTNKIFHQYDAL